MSGLMGNHMTSTLFGREHDWYVDMQLFLRHFMCEKRHDQIVGRNLVNEVICLEN